MYVPQGSPHPHRCLASDRGTMAPPSAMRPWLLILFLGATSQLCRGDDLIIAPHQGPTGTGTIFPFLIKETCPYCTNKPTMRYQQVYNSSLFTNASHGSIYVTTLTFYGASAASPSVDWIVPSMQINLSTTSKTADNLSMVFAENVGPDDTMVLAPTSYYFPDSPDVILFNRPFRYTPPLGNLLLDVRIFDGSGDPFPPPDPFPQMQAYSSPTDECSRVWSTNVTAVTASGGDTIGLDTLIELSPIPSLQAQYVTNYEGTHTNMIIISWPSVPTNFVLQTSREIATAALWKTATNHVFGAAGPNYLGYDWSIVIPASSAGAAAFYRLVWPNGYALTTTVTVPKPAAPKVDESTR